MSEAVEEREGAGIPLGVRAMPACGLVVVESRFEPEHTRPVKDAYSRFYLFVAGQARSECGGRHHMLGADTLCHIPAGQTHRL